MKAYFRKKIYPQANDWLGNLFISFVKLSHWIITLNGGIKFSN